MFVDQRPIPFFLKGPDASRCYARDYHRWSVVSGEDGDPFLAKVVLKKGWGRGETISALLMPIVTFAMFGSICLAILHFDPDNKFVSEFFIAIVGISLMLLVVNSLLIWMEVACFAHQSEVVLTCFENHEFSLGEDSNRKSLPPGSILKYTLHHPPPGVQGASALSELDLVVRDGDEVKAIHKLMAHQGNWCWRHAQKLSEFTKLPLRRVALQSTGKPFPPGRLD